MSEFSLYRRVLGARLDLLPEPLRRFHDSAAGGRAEGTVRIVRGDGIIRGIIAGAFGLPLNADNVSVRVTVIPEGERERWVRNFGGRELASVQWEEDGLLIEQISSTRFAFNLVPDGRGLTYELKRSSLGPIQIPRFLAPRVSTTTLGSADGWHLSMRTEVPLLGRLLEYHGDIRCLS